MNNELLLIPDKDDIERAAVEKAWKTAGGQVVKVGKFWKGVQTEGKRVAIYGNDTFSLVLAQVLNLNLISVKDEIIAKIHPVFTKREIDIILPTQLKEVSFPFFVKPVTPKLFKAAVVKEEEELTPILKGLKEEKLILSEVKIVEKEIRAFVLNKKIVDLAYYEGNGELQTPTVFINSFLSKTELVLPKTFVLDIGWNENDGWFILELNSSWGAGLNGCSPSEVITCIREATIN